LSALGSGEVGLCLVVLIELCFDIIVNATYLLYQALARSSFSDRMADLLE
jgi:hypothetical protein